MKLSIIMPMYNSPDIQKNIAEAKKNLARLKIPYEIVIVDDGSSNNCYTEAQELEGPRVKVVGYRQNQGKGNAIRHGFKYVSGNYVGFVDSGRDINPYQLGRFLAIMRKEKADIVIGSKRHVRSKVHYPAARRLMSRTYQLINHILFNLDVQDTQVGLKLFRYEVLKKIFPKIAVKRFAFDLELLVIARKMRAKIVEAPVEIRYKFHSTINLKAVFWILVDTVAIFYRDKVLKYYENNEKS
ncbi:MAG TPA: glycosyltransferase [Candidatus Nanoarchaeia archaeon]|nr:glycosyltransferase [Candidatus Nanoarchaeia archaeon]